MNLIVNREQAFVALFEKLKTIPTLKLCTRRLKHWQDVPKEDQPALFMQVADEEKRIVDGKPARYVLGANLWVYVNTDGDEVGPLLNPVLDVIERALEPLDGADRRQTLGGIVHHCWIEGTTQIFEGDLGDEAVAIIPVKILVT